MISDSKDNAWSSFTPGEWQEKVNVRDFIQKNYTPYEGDDSFLTGATKATDTLWASVAAGIKQENETLAPVDLTLTLSLLLPLMVQVTLTNL